MHLHTFIKIAGGCSCLWLVFGGMALFPEIGSTKQWSAVAFDLFAIPALLLLIGAGLTKIFVTRTACRE